MPKTPTESKPDPAKPRTLNWCYGARLLSDQAPVDNQIRQANHFRNSLVRIERDRRDASLETAAKLHPPLAESRSAYQQADQAVEDAYAAVKQARAKARSRIPATPEQTEAINSAKAARRIAAAEMAKHTKEGYRLLKEAQQKVIDQAEAEFTEANKDADPPLTPKQVTLRFKPLKVQALADAGLDAGELAAYHAIKRARADSPVYWGTRGAIEQAAGTFRSGPPPRFLKYRGDGSVAIQFQGGITVAKLLSGQCNQLQLTLPPDDPSEHPEDMPTSDRIDLSDKFSKWGTGNFLINPDCPDGNTHLRFRFAMHRPFPPDAVVKWAFLDRREIAGSTENNWTFRLTLQTHDRPDEATNDLAVTVHPGFRSAGLTGGLRIATWVGEDGRSGSIVMNSRHVDSFSVPDRLKSVRDAYFNFVQPELSAWLKTLPESHDITEHLKTLPQWKSVDNLEDYVRLRWQQNRFPEDQQSPETFFPKTLSLLQQKLEDYQRSANYRPRVAPDLTTVFGLVRFWASFDRHLRSWAANQHRSSVSRRDHLVRNALRDLRRSYGRLVLAKTDWKSLGRNANPDEESLDALHRPARVASPGRTAQLCREVWSGHVTDVSPKHITGTCHQCNEMHEFNRANKYAVCPHCNCSWDQDYNACINTLSSGGVADESMDAIRREFREESEADSDLSKPEPVDA